MLAALLALLALGTATAAEKPSHGTVLVLPFAASGEGAEWTGLAISESVLDFVAQVNQDNFVTLKQLDAVLRPRDLKLADAASLAPKAQALGRSLGATDVIVGDVIKKGDIWTVEGKRLNVLSGSVLKTAKVQGSKAVLPILTKRLAGELVGTTTKAPPLGKDQKALDEAAHCGALLARQSLSPRAKGLLEEAVVKEAEALCRAALQSDPNLGLARAGLAVALAIQGQYDEAKAEARQAQKGRFVPLAVLAESFALRRSGDAAAARTVLDDAVVARPGFLHALGYLGEERLEVRDNPAAKVDFERYLKRAPGHPWGLAKLGHALARLGKKDEAIQVTKEALAHDPDDPELNIELASRLIDAGKDAEAEGHLRAAMDATPPRTLAGLRLGYLYLRGKRLKDAKDLFNRVIAAATRTDESRLRAVAQADLARVAALEGNLAEAVQRLGAAKEEGLRKMPCDEPAFAQWKDKPELVEACKEPEGKGGQDSLDPDASVAVDF
jgi:tetratricopeptide (TPR) repeat protein